MQPIVVVVVVVLMTDGVQPCWFWGAGAKESLGIPSVGIVLRVGKRRWWVATAGDGRWVDGCGDLWATRRRLRGCFGVTGGICGM